MVSGSISLPSSGFFSPFPHGTRSLSVSQEYLALPDGPGRFAQDSSCPALLRIPLGRLSLRVRVCHPLRTYFPECSAHDQRATAWSYNPRYASPHTGFGLFPVRSPLLGESFIYFLFLQVLRCFSSLRSPPGHCRDDRRRRPGCPIRKSAGQGIFAPYRGLSQLITSFIASVSQGIRHAPLLTLYRRHPLQRCCCITSAECHHAHTFSCILSF